MGPSPYTYQPLPKPKVHKGIRRRLYTKVKKIFEPNPAGSEQDDAQPMHIRVLIIQPGAFKDDLQVVLRHAVLDPTRSIPEFDALSYVWGPPEPKERVYLDNKTHYLDIGINLGVALRHLRYKDKTRAIWADAVCINQPDPEELGDQVRQMGTLYRLARRVIAWLGPEEDNSARAMDVLKDLGANLKPDWVMGMLRPAPESTPEKAAFTMKMIPWEIEDIQCFNSLFRRGWFDRLWIRQEIYLSHEKALVQVGDRTMPWQHFAMAAIRVMLNENLNFAYGDLGVSLHKRLSQLQDLFSHLPVFLASLRRVCGRCRCFDARDRVYGVMNMLPEEDRRLIGFPDYTLPAAEVWKKTVVSYIRHYLEGGPGSLPLLILNECTGEEPFDKPTWVPNWEIKDVEDPIRIHTSPGMSGTLITPHISFPDGDTLRVLGVPVGEIRSIVEVPRPGDLHTSVRRFLQQLDLNQAYPGGGTYADACASTLRAGHIRESTLSSRDDHPTLAEMRSAMEKVMSLEEPEKRPPEGSEAAVLLMRFQNAISEALVGRYLVITESGHVGVAPRTSKPGDIFVAFAGGYSLVVLRPSKDPKRPNSYYLIGSSYVHGFMSLEAFLGPLPENHRYVYGTLPEEEDYGTFRLMDDTGELTGTDPRLLSWPIADEYLAALEGDEYYTIDVLAEKNRSMGVQAQFFDII